MMPARSRSLSGCFKERKKTLPGEILLAAKLDEIGGPDGIRTRDLGLDRAACLAATPRDQAEGSLP